MSRKSTFIGLLGIVLFVFSNGNWTLPVCAWLAPIFLLGYLSGPFSGKKLFILFIALIAASKLMFNGIIPNSIGALTYILTVYYAVLWIIPFWAHAALARRINGFKSTLVFPATWVMMEYLNAEFFGSWASVAYTQYGDLPLMQLVSVTGIWGLSFLVMWFGSVVDWCWKKDQVFHRIQSKGWIFGGVFLAVLIYGGLRILLYNPQSDTPMITSFTPFEEIAEYKKKLKEEGYYSTFRMMDESKQKLIQLLDVTHRDMFSRMEEIIHPASRLLIWPEAAVNVLEEQESAFLSKGIDFTRKHDLYLILGYYLIPADRKADRPENKAAIINPSGQIEFEYLKAYPVPGAAHKAGEKNIPFVATSFGRVGVAICYDMDFPNLIVQAGRKKVDIMVVPSWDWKAIDPLHTHMALFRGIENGCSVIRQTGEGLSLATDAIGTVRSHMDYFTTEDHVMLSQVPTSRYPTLYSVLGDYFAWSCGLLFIGLIFLSRRSTES